MGLENEQSPEKREAGESQLAAIRDPRSCKCIQRGPEQLEGRGGLRRRWPFEEPVSDSQVSLPASV